MKSLSKILFIVFLLNTNGSAQINEKFFKALAIIESGNNPMAYGRKRNEIGIYQIREAYFIDAQNINSDKANKYGLNNVSHKDCFNPEISKRVVRAYLEYYSKGNYNIERLARIHNGGPKPPIKKTNVYWLKFQKIYNSLK